MNRKRLRISLIEQGKRLVDLHRSTGIPYNRIVRIANGYSTPRAEELCLIAEALHLTVIRLSEPEAGGA